MITQTISNVVNPFTGVFGSGQIKMYTTNGTFSVPLGVSNVRVRLWGGGATPTSTNGGAGGGFSIKEINLSGIQSVSVVVGSANGTSSFGSYVSATGGTNTVGGSGVGGDINSNGGSAQAASSSGGGGVGGLFGNGGNGNSSTSPGGNGNAGGGSGSSASGAGGSGIFGSGGVTNQMPQSGLTSASIDFLGVGGGGTALTNSSPNGINGGGGAGNSGYGGFPGGGGGYGGTGANGLVIVEY